jgi:hypothetical protein
LFTHSLRKRKNGGNVLGANNGRVSVYYGDAILKALYFWRRAARLLPPGIIICPSVQIASGNPPGVLSVGFYVARVSHP